MTKPTHEQIAIRAALLWKAQGSPGGRDEAIWLEAERQLADEAREMLSGTEDRSKLSSEEPALPPEARRGNAGGGASVASEQMAPKPGRRRSSHR